MLNLKKDYNKTKHQFIYQHKTNGTYAVSLSLSDRIYNKQQMFRKVNLAKIKDAQQFIAEKRAEFTKQEIKRPKKGLRLNEAYKLYINNCELLEKKGNMEDSTLNGKRSIFKNQILPKLGNVKIEAISEDHINKFHKDLLTTPSLRNKDETLKNQTLIKVHKQLSAFLNWCVKKKMLSVNPAGVIGNFKKVKVEKEYLTYQEFKKVLSVVDNIRDYFILELLFYTGLRVGELLGLTLDNIVTTEAGTSLNITKIYYQNKIKYKAKTDESIDDLFLDDITVKTFNAFLEDRQTRNIESDFIFANNRGDCEVIGDKAIRDMIKKWVKLAGINKNIAAHSFRHSCAAFLISRGYQLEDIKARLRHGDIRTTSNLYGHMYKERKILLAEELTTFRNQNDED